MKKILRLTLKKKWFDLIASGEKKEEYREFKHYWAVRLCVAHSGAIGGEFMDKHRVIAYTFKHFDAVEFKHGYAANAPTMLFECNGIDIGPAKPEWSDNWQGDVFRIKLGERIDPSPIDGN